MSKESHLNCLSEELDSAQDLMKFFFNCPLFQPRTTLDVSGKYSNFFMFRGQSSDWPLLPTAHRRDSLISNFTPQPPRRPESYSCRSEFVKDHAKAEIKAVQLFLEAADKVGIKTPLNYSDLGDNDKLLHSTNAESFIDSGQEFPHHRFLPSMALAQHYGVPTRLLDWTSSPWVAAFMAAYSNFKKSDHALDINSIDSEDRIYIYCLNWFLIKDLDGVRVFTAPRAYNTFLKAQEGMFSLVTNANQFYLKNGKWPCLEDLIKSHTKSNQMSTYIKVSIPKSESVALLKLLYRIGISPLTMMPSLHAAAFDFEYKRKVWDSEIHG